MVAQKKLKTELHRTIKEISRESKQRTEKRKAAYVARKEKAEQAGTPLVHKTKEQKEKEQLARKEKKKQGFKELDLKRKSLKRQRPKKEAKTTEGSTKPKRKLPTRILQDRAARKKLSLHHKQLFEQYNARKEANAKKRKERRGKKKAADTEATTSEESVPKKDPKKNRQISPKKGSTLSQKSPFRNANF